MIKGKYDIKKVIKTNHFIIFIPLLLLYLLIVLIFAKNQFRADESGYIWLAENIIKGQFTLPGKLLLSWGPGYSLILIPFVWLKSPLLVIKILNAFFLYFSIILFYKTLLIYIPKKKAMFLSFLMGLYFPPFKLLPFIMTEIFTIFIICLLIYITCKMFNGNKFAIKQVIMVSIILGYLALTKVIFGYVILVALVLFSIIYIFKKSTKVRTSIKINVLALIFCVPYLFYTYSISNKCFFWSNSAGGNLYWMSTPYPEEYGNCEIHFELDRDSQLYENHYEFFDQISKLEAIEWGEALKKQALSNIKNHPGKYFKNWIANIGRLLFSYPFSYGKQSLHTYFTLIPNMFIVVIALLLIYPTIKTIRKIPYEILFLLVIAAIYIFGSSLVSAFSRHFYIIVPIIGVWMSYMLGKVIKIEYK